MFGQKAAAASFSERERTLLEEAVNRLGIPPLRWRRRDAEFTLRGEPTRLDIDAIRHLLAEKPDATSLALSLAEALEFTPPVEFYDDPRRFHALLRPRLVHPRELAGPRRTMCRREVFGGLLQAVAIGSGPNAPYVTTALLDRWKADFDDFCAVASHNLSKVITNKHILEVDGAPGLLALLHDDEQASAAVFILDHLFPPDLLPQGVVFAVPAPEVLVVFPVIEGSGPDGLAAIVQASYSLAHEREDPLSEHTFWRREGRVIDLPMTAVHDHRSRRIHIEAKGPLEDLLRILGAIE